MWNGTGTWPPLWKRTTVFDFFCIIPTWRRPPSMNAACFPFVRNSLMLLSFAGLAGMMAPTMEAAEPLPGKYSGKTGTTGRISFKVRGNKVSNLNVSIFALGQEVTTALFTEYQVLASNTDRKRFRLKRSGRFLASGVDKNGIRYKVDGKLKGQRKFKGTVEMSDFRFSRYIFNPFTGFYDPEYQLVSGSRNYVAKR